MTNAPTSDHTNITRQTSFVLLAVGLAWMLAVIAAANAGILLMIPMPAIAILVALGILLPTAAYFASRHLQAYIASIGLYPLTLLHVWRVPAAIAFFAFGLAGELPLVFWVLAGTGDLMAGLFAVKVIASKPDNTAYRNFHLFGFADFVVAVGTGLTFTLMHDPLMATIAKMPMALIPLFGVGISGASHLIAFDLLRRTQHSALSSKTERPKR